MVNRKLLGGPAILAAFAGLTFGAHPAHLWLFDQPDSSLAAHAMYGDVELSDFAIDPGKL